MGRVKVSPRVAQPDPERPTITPQPQEETSVSNEHLAISNRGSDNEVNHAPEKSLLSKMTTIVETDQPRTRERSPAEDLAKIGHRPVPKVIICPHCQSRIPNTGIKEFREHVESCSRPATGDSESTTSSLSPPPASRHGEDADDEIIDLDHLKPYVAGESTLYPEIMEIAAANGELEIIDAQPRTSFAKLTDLQKFIDSLEDMEELPYEVVFNRVQNASVALIQWQNEWMDLDKFIEVTEPPAGATAKPHKNPRIPKDTQIGQGYRDELESFIYGFEYQYHQHKVGRQNPSRQRHTNGANGGRELRQRVPTQKAVEADLSTSPDSDEGIGTRRRGRTQKLREGTTDVDLSRNRGQRMRNDSQIDSQSRDQTPVSTFPSGKKRGRPAKPKVGGAIRLQELQREGGYDYESTPEPSHDQHVTNSTENPTLMTRKRGYGSHETVETTENWQDDTEQEEPTSRPGTSDSAMTILSDDMRNPPVRSSGRGRKRQNTSDFEDALPSYKRIRKTNIPTTNGFNDGELALPTKDFNNAEKTRNTRRSRQEDEALPGNRTVSEGALDNSTPRSHDANEAQENSAFNIDNTMHKGQKERKIITLKTSNGKSRTPANSNLAKNTATDLLLGSSLQQDGKDGPKVSRASLNMRRRWAAKKQAEALGLPVPKIGRYPKGGSAPLTPDVVAIPDPLNPPKPPGGRKRKRDEEESNTANIGVSDSVIKNEAPVIVKRRGGRPKKNTNMQTPNIEHAVHYTISEGVRSNNSASDQPDTKNEEEVLEIAPKRKGGRPRKKPLEIESPSPEAQEGLQQNEETSYSANDNISKVDDAESDIPVQDGKSTNEDPSGEQPQLRRTTRVRRQTSAALSASSQALTQRSGRSSQKSTVTPTPAPQRAGEETVIKQEAGAGPLLPRKRGRKPKSVVADISSEATVAAQNVIEGEAPPAKRRKVVRAAQASTESTPEISSEEHAAPEGESTPAQKLGSLKGKTNYRGADVAASDAPSITPGSSVEPLIPKKRGRRPRNNAVTGNSVADMIVKEGNKNSLPEPLITRARSSGLDSATKSHLIEKSTLNLEAADGEPPKKKGNWVGKRTKGTSDTNNGIIGALEETHTTNPGDPEPDVQDNTDRHLFLDSQNQKSSHMAMPLSGEAVVDTADLVGLSDVTSRPKRLVTRTATLSREVDDHKAELEGPSYSFTRPKRATTMAEVPTNDTTIIDTVVGASSDGPSRPKRAATISAALGRDMIINDTRTEALSNTLPRPKRGMHIIADHDEGVGEGGADGSIPGILARPKRVVTMKLSPAGAAIAENGESSPNAISVTESIGTEVNKQAEKKKGKWDGRHGKTAKVADRTGDEEVPTKVESDNEKSDSEGTRKEKKALAAKVSKAMKNSQSMKARWANGSMREVMEKKKERNLAKKAAAARAAENGEDLGDVTAGLDPAPASVSAKRRAAPTKPATRGPKRRRTMNATMDGPADTDDEYDIPEASSSGPTSPTSRKTLESDHYQQLSSPIRSPYNRRKRRPAALRASQSFSKFTDDVDDADIMEDKEDEDVETELKKQFDSEYEHFRALTPPSHRGLQPSNILAGKRKPKPVMNLAEAMRIEAGDEDDFLIEG